MSETLAVLRDQFELVWALAEVHLDALSDDDLLWAPASHHWTVHRGADGIWRPDWGIDDDGNEPDPAPVPTGAWISWHLGWWWTTALDQLRGVAAPEREQVPWPGSATAAVSWLRGLADDWRTLLADLGEQGAHALDVSSPFPWPPNSYRSAADTIAWAHAELMKNVAEIGQLRMLRAADRPKES